MSRKVRGARLRVAATGLAIAVVTAIVAAVPAQAARHSRAEARCTVVFNAAPWTIHGSGSGTAYKVVAAGMSCTVARTWVRRLSRLKGASANGAGLFHGGPAGFTCHSFSTPASGDKLIYAGACAAPHGHPFFGWGAKLA